jgi:hypothetical protein
MIGGDWFGVFSANLENSSMPLGMGHGQSGLKVGDNEP